MRGPRATRDGVSLATGRVLDPRPCGWWDDAACSWHLCPAALSCRWTTTPSSPASQTLAASSGGTSWGGPTGARAACSLCACVCSHRAKRPPTAVACMLGRSLASKRGAWRHHTSLIATLAAPPHECVCAGSTWCSCWLTCGRSTSARSRCRSWTSSLPRCAVPLEAVGRPGGEPTTLAPPACLVHAGAGQLAGLLLCCDGTLSATASPPRLEPC